MPKFDHSQLKKGRALGCFLLGVLLFPILAQSGNELLRTTEAVLQENIAHLKKLEERENYDSGYTMNPEALKKQLAPFCSPTKSEDEDSTQSLYIHRERYQTLEQTHKRALGWITKTDSYLESYKSQISTTEQDSTRTLLIQDAERLISKFKPRREQIDRLLRETKICLFRREIKKEIEQTLNPEARKKLESLSTVAQCLRPCENLNEDVLKNSKGIFDSIFESYSKKPELTDQDCAVLRNTYEVWSSFYDLENKTGNNDREKIPFYNVNPHNAAYFYWMKEKAKGRIPEGGLSLLHFDTHSDVQHVHNHTSHGMLRSIPFVHLGNLLHKVQSSDSQGLDRYLAELDEKGVWPSTDQGQKSKKEFFDWIKKTDQKKLITDMEQTIRDQVHMIAQPVVAAAATDISRDVSLFLPPWSREFNLSPIDPKTGTVTKQKMKVVEDGGNVRLAYDPKDDPLKISEKGYHALKPLYPTSKYFHDVTLSIGTTNAEKKSSSGSIEWSEEEDKKLPKISSYLTTKKFILDIDLDGFVSEGISNDIVRPKSYERTVIHERKSGPHGSHNQSAETSQFIEVSTREMDLIKKRIDSFFRRLKEAKDAGYTPEVITVADSTILQRALRGESADGLSGGNFTPNCLVFLLNYTVRQKLKEIYPVDIKN